jgi:hypothetical protein
MSDGGSISNMITYYDDEGRPRRSLIVTSHDTVEINVDTPQRQAFKRADLLLAMGAVEEHHRPEHLAPPEVVNRVSYPKRHSYQCATCGYHPCVCTEP